MFHPRCIYPARTGTHTTCVQRERFSAARCNYFSPGHFGSDHSFFAPSDSKGAATSGGRGRKEGRKEGRGLLESSARLSLGQLLRAAIYGSGIAYLSIAACMYAAK